MRWENEAFFCLMVLMLPSPNSSFRCGRSNNRMSSWWFFKRWGSTVLLDSVILSWRELNQFNQSTEYHELPYLWTNSSLATTWEMGLGLMSLLLGILNITTTNLCWRWNIPNSWVMFNWDIYQPLWFIYHCGSMALMALVAHPEEQKVSQVYFAVRRS